MRSQKLVNLITAFSLGLFVALTALWVRGRSTADIFHWTGASRRGQEVTIFERHLTFSGGSAWWWDRTVRTSYGSSDDASLIVRLADQPSFGHMTRPAFAIRSPREGWTWLGFEGSRRSSAVPTGVSQLSGAVVATAGSDEMVTLLVPLWSLTAPAAVPPILWLARRGHRRRRRRQRLGLCVACGYDIRATPDRCPECGRSPAA
jgi:hypothetical protein